MIERPEFKDGNAAFVAALNEVVEYARRHGVNVEGLPDWEQTPDGWRPRESSFGASTNGLRPFQVREIAPDPEAEDPDPIVQVNTGYIGNCVNWDIPSWSGSDDFNTDKTLTASHGLWAQITIGQAEVAVNTIDPTTSANLEWRAFSAGAPTHESGVHEFEVDFSAETVSSNFYPETDYTIHFPIATVYIDGTGITEIRQYVDYNVMIPKNANKYYNVVPV